MMQVPVDFYGNPIPGMASIPVATPVSQQPLVYRTIPTVDNSLLNQRVYTARPETVVVEKPSDGSVTVPETPIKSETDLVPVEKKAVESQPVPATGDDQTEKSSNPADERPSLDLDDAADSSKVETDLALPGLDSPARPDLNEPADKPTRPIGT